MYIKNLKQKKIYKEGFYKSFGTNVVTEEYFDEKDFKENFLKTKTIVEVDKDFSIKLNGKSYVVPKTNSKIYKSKIIASRTPMGLVKNIKIRDQFDNLVESDYFIFDEFDNEIKRSEITDFSEFEDDRGKRIEKKYEKGKVVYYKESIIKQNFDLHDSNPLEVEEKILKEYVYEYNYYHHEPNLIKSITIINKCKSNLKYVKEYVYNENNKIKEIVTSYTRFINKNIKSLRFELEHIVFDYNVDGSTLLTKDIYEFEDEYIDHPSELFEERNNLNYGKTTMKYFYSKDFNQEVCVNKKTAKCDAYLYPKDDKGRIIAKIHYRNNKLIESEEYTYFD